MNFGEELTGSRRYEVMPNNNNNNNHTMASIATSASNFNAAPGSNPNSVRFQTVSMSATSSSSKNNNHVATQNNVMMSSVAVDTSMRSDVSYA